MVCREPQGQIFWGRSTWMKFPRATHLVCAFQYCNLELGQRYAYKRMRLYPMKCDGVHTLTLPAPSALVQPTYK